MLKLYSHRVAQFPPPVRLVIFLLVLMAVWLPIAAPIYWIWGTGNTASTVALLILYSEFIGLLHLWGRLVHHHAYPLQYHGLVRTRSNGLELLRGLGLGFVSLFCLFLVEGWLGWLSWNPSSFSSRIVLGGLLVALGLGFAEELLFRGWLVDELRQDYRPQITLWSSSSIYALLHFVKPWSEIVRTFPSFPGLLLLGLTLGWARQIHCGRLGFAIGLHAGLVWGYYIVNVGNLVRYLDRVPVWVTGIDRNPLSGGMGLLFLSLLGLSLKRFSESK